MNYQEIIEQERNKLCPNQTLIGFDEEFAIRLMKSAVSQAEQDKWIDVRTQKPEKWKEVIVCFEYLKDIVQAYWSGDDWRGSYMTTEMMNDGYVNDNKLCVEPYKWQPLPPSLSQSNQTQK